MRVIPAQPVMDAPPAMTHTRNLGSTTVELFDPRIILNQTPLPVPRWAIQLADRIATDHDINTPELAFYRGSNGSGGGWYNDLVNEIVVITVFDLMSDLLTVVHEMSHAIVGYDHSPEMYEKMLELVELFGLNERLAIRQELAYQPETFATAFYRRYMT